MRGPFGCPKSTKRHPLAPTTTSKACSETSQRKGLEKLKVLGTWKKFRTRNSIKDKRAIHAAAAERAKSGGKPPAKPKPPGFKNGMTLRDYQVTSFEWMIGNYRRRTNVILGDEMVSSSSFFFRTGNSRLTSSVLVNSHRAWVKLRSASP